MIFVYCFLLARIETRVVFFVACKNSKILVNLDLTLSLTAAAAAAAGTISSRTSFGSIILCRWVLLKFGNFRYFFH